MKNSSDTMRNLTRDHLVCSAVPQPTSPPHVPAMQNYQKQTVIFLINGKSRKYTPLTVQFKNLSPIKIKLMMSMDKTQYTCASPKETNRALKKVYCEDLQITNGSQCTWSQSSRRTSTQQRNQLTFILLT